MTAMYDATIFLNIALLAVAVSVFVLAASLLGRALEMSRREEEESLERDSEETDRTLTSLKTQLEKEKGTEAIRRIEEQIRKHKATNKAREKALHRSQRAYGLLSVRECVVYPGVFFVLPLGLSGSAKAVTLAWAPVALWLGALVVAAFGVYRLYECLMVIQRVAITSEEAQHKRMAAALTTALEAHDDARRAELFLGFKERKPPFTFAPNVQETIRFSVALRKGDVARNTEVWFFSPEGFEFPGSESWKQDATFTALPGALTTKVKLGDIRKGTSGSGSVTMKVPSKAGEHVLLFRLYCDGFTGEREQFVVKVS